MEGKLHQQEAVDESDRLVALQSLLEGRHSVRGFRDNPVPRELIERALETASRAPSWCNTQPWQVIITEGPATTAFRAAMTDAVRSSTPAPDFPFPARYTGVYRDRRLETALQLYDAVGITRGDRVASAEQGTRNFEFFDAPHVAVLTTEADLGTYGVLDAGLFLAALLLAFEGLGIGAVPQAALAAYAPRVREHFWLPASRAVVCAVSFGWEDHGHPANGFRTTRAPGHSFSTWHS
jgi:nitroreductase